MPPQDLARALLGQNASEEDIRNFVRQMAEMPSQQMPRFLDQAKRDAASFVEPQKMVPTPERSFPAYWAMGEGEKQRANIGTAMDLGSMLLPGLGPKTVKRPRARLPVFDRDAQSPTLKASLLEGLGPRPGAPPPRPSTQNMRPPRAGTPPKGELPPAVEGVFDIDAMAVKPTQDQMLKEIQHDLMASRGALPSRMAESFEMPVDPMAQTVLRPSPHAPTPPGQPSMYDLLAKTDIGQALLRMSPLGRGLSAAAVGLSAASGPLAALFWNTYDRRANSPSAEPRAIPLPRARQIRTSTGGYVPSDR